MSMRQWICFSGTLLVLGVLSMALPGCGGGEQTTGDATKPVIVNPTPEAAAPEGGAVPGK
jgi:hypothetical protein